MSFFNLFNTIYQSAREDHLSTLAWICRNVIGGQYDNHKPLDITTDKKPNFYRSLPVINEKSYPKFRHK